MIVADDLGWNDVSFHGSSQIPTPHIDKLASEGIILNNYYTLPMCTPSRAALMTGRYPIHTGMQAYVIRAFEGWGLGLDETILPQYLKQQGYRTHAIGKWNLGHYAKEFTPTYRGFDSYYGHYIGWNDYWTHRVDNVYEGLDLHHNEKPVRDQGGNYSTEMFTAEAEDRISHHESSEPLFLYVSYTAPHSVTHEDPIQAPQEWIDKYKHIKHEQRRKYAAVVGYMDHGVGRIYKALERKGLLDDSVILFTTDNGGAPDGAWDNWGSNHPLRGIKATLFEGGVRGTAFVHGRMLKHPGRVSRDLIHITDWLPTFVKLAGGHVTVDKQLDGFDVWNTLQNKEPSPRREILLNIDPQKYMNLGLIYDGWKIVKQGRSDISPKWNGWYPPPELPADNTNITSGSQVKCEPTGGGKTSSECVEELCLFNLVVDPCEYHDVSKRYPHIMKEMKLRLELYENSMVPPRRNTTRDPLSDPKLHHGVWDPWVHL